MSTLKFSRQRKAIKDYLLSTTAHPTADMVYLHLRETFPNISLGTVYRNLNLLTDLGEAIKITTPDGGDRFDGITRPHSHFFCKCCGCVQDILFEESPGLEARAAAHFDGQIESHTTLFYGLCRDCAGQGESRKAAPSAGQNIK